MKATIQEYADSLGAKLTLPSDPKRPRDIFAKTDVTATWARFQPPSRPIVRLIERRTA